MSQLTINGITDGILGIASKCNSMFTDIYTNFKKVIATLNAQTVNYTLALTDAGAKVLINVASANTITVPPNASVAFAVGTVVDVYQMGAGVTTIVAGSGVTINAPNGLALNGQYTAMQLIQTAANVWLAVPAGITYTTENIANKSSDTTMGGVSPSSTLYPNQAAVNSYVTTISANLQSQITSATFYGLAAMGMAN
jgi:hypothetical protein